MTEPGQIKFSCPENMEYWSKKVFSGEYFVDPRFQPALPEEPIILDIGANCGAFSLWSLQQWPKAKVFAYEPTQIAFSYLKENTEPYPQITAHRVAVLASDKRKLYAGAQNQGQASFFEDVNPLLDGTYEEPPVMKPDDLPVCQVMKVDTEGCEVEIIERYIYEVTHPQLILFEYHREEDRKELDSLLCSQDYFLAGSHSDQPHRGVLKYVRHS